MPSPETSKEQNESLHGSRWVVPGSRLLPTPGAAGLQSGSPPDVGPCSGSGDDQPFRGDDEAARPSLIDNWIDA
ncbi:MAG: hypothetical protein WAK31_04045 [Chthoniobacterales bacterium]